MLTADLRREQSCGARGFRSVRFDLLKHGDLLFAPLSNRLVPPSGRTENLDRKVLRQQLRENFFFARLEAIRR